MLFLNKLFHFVITITAKYQIDESHGLQHSMNVLMFAKQIYHSEVERSPVLKTHANIVYVSAILHDMCDKKYMDEKVGLREIKQFLREMKYDMVDNSDSEGGVGGGLHNAGVGVFSEYEMDSICEIIGTMSYSKVKKHGFPSLGDLDLAYHIVREADLLAAYDFERCIIYNMKKSGGDLVSSFLNARELFEKRVFLHMNDGLFKTNEGRKQAVVLHEMAVQRIHEWESLLGMDPQ